MPKYQFKCDKCGRTVETPNLSTEGLPCADELKKCDGILKYVWSVPGVIWRCEGSTRGGHQK